MHATAALFGYQQIDTPILESAGLFVRGVGEGTDIVDKEMYIFQDKDRRLRSACAPSLPPG